MGLKKSKTSKGSKSKMETNTAEKNKKLSKVNKEKGVKAKKDRADKRKQHEKNKHKKMQKYEERKRKALEAKRYKLSDFEEDQLDRCQGNCCPPRALQIKLLRITMASKMLRWEQGGLQGPRPSKQDCITALAWEGFYCNV